jgi:hypothetical protein
MPPPPEKAQKKMGRNRSKEMEGVEGEKEFVAVAASQ